MSGEREILLVRHPETAANALGRHVARGDSAYSELGVLQASALSRAVRGWRPDAIACSPQRRALVPALESASGLCPLRIDPDLREFDVGLAEGLSHQEGVDRGLISEEDWTGPDALPYVGGERVVCFVDRCRAAWSRILATDGRVAAFSHRGVIAVMLVEALGLPVERMWDYLLEPAHGALVRLVDGVAAVDSLDALPLVLDGGTMHSNP